MPSGDLERLVPVVLGDRHLQQQLLATADRAAFTATVCLIAAEQGLAVTEDDVAEALRAARRRWLERWV